jgi:hypothetical protein
MRERRERVIKPFTNSFGQVIEPGTPVFVVTTCTHRTNITRGEYIGYIERDVDRFDQRIDHRVLVTVKEPFVQVRVEYDQAYYVYKDTEERVNWKTYASNRDCEWRSEKAHRITTLNYNRILRADSSVEDLAAAV